MSRNKGKRGEREVLEMVQYVVSLAYASRGLDPPKLKRNTLQSDGGGYDIVGVDWLALECKRCETLALGAWWEQAKQQARPGQTPVLAYRRNGGKWRFRLVGLLQVTNNRGLRMLADVNEETFLTWVRMRCDAEIDGAAVALGLSFIDTRGS